MLSRVERTKKSFCRKRVKNGIVQSYEVGDKKLQRKEFAEETHAI
jgi:hypothetical protein